MDILEEYLPSGISCLIVGPPGSGKTILSQHLMFRLLKREQFVICIASQNQVNLINQQKKLFKWGVSSFLRSRQLGIIEIGDVTDPTELNISLTQAIREGTRPLSLVVVDSLTVLMVGMEERKIMKFTEALARKLQEQNVSLILLATPTKETEDFLTKMKSLVSSVIEIKLRERGTIRRYMRIFKFLDRKHSTQWYPFEISERGIQFSASPVPAPPSDIVLLPKMMLIEEIPTPFLGFDSLTDEIKRKRLSCILEAQLPSGQGIMLFSEGECVLPVIAGRNGNKIRAHQVLENQIKTKKGTLTIHSVPTRIIHLLMGYLEDQVLFKNLSSEQIQYTDILENLSESEFSGCIVLRGYEEQGLVFIDEGKILEAYFENDRIFRSKEALSALEEAASKGNFQIDIYFAPRLKKPLEKREQPSPAKDKEAPLPDFIPTGGATVQGAFINATLHYLQHIFKTEWSSTVYYPRPLEDIALNKVEEEILRLKTMNDPYLKRSTHKLRRGYKDRERYPADEYQDIVYAVTRMLEFSWSYENQNHYEGGWGKLSKAYFELGKTVYSSMTPRTKKSFPDYWYDLFVREMKKWKDMGGFSDLESSKNGKKLILRFIGDIELSPRRKGMLWGLLEGVGLRKFHIDIVDDTYVITFG
jgi:KaiC/GvpD/RAD55 family RecA-like ATPase